MSKTISAAANPALANKLINQVMQEPEELAPIDPTIKPPSDNAVELPGGYVTATGEVIRTAEVRELNGRDEEAISKSNSLGKALMTILQRGTVKIGNLPATEEVLDTLLSGDRDMLLLGILKNTFGANVEVPIYCTGCEDSKLAQVNVDEHIKVKVLADPIEDRYFVVQGKPGDILVQLPDGRTQKELINNADKTAAELNTILLERTVTKIGNMPVYDKLQVQNLGVVDRRKIIEEINKRVPGPQFDDVTTACPDCGSEVSVPINLGSLFQF